MLSAVLVLAQSAFAPVPATFSEGFVAVSRSAGAPLLLFDTGAAESIIPESADLPEIGAPKRILKPRLKMFEMPIAGMSIQGVLGCDLLQGRQALVDYREKRLLLRKGLALSAAEARAALAEGNERVQRVPMTFKDGCYFLDVQFDKSIKTLLLDTGANVLSLSPEDIAELGLPQVGEAQIGTAQGVAKMAVHRSGTVRVGSVLLAGSKVFAEQNPEGDGTIGLWVITQSRAIIDFEGKALWLRTN